MATDPVISLTGITKSFGSIRALDGVSLMVNRGVFGIIGPNGAGKTTLLKIMLGLVRPDSGRGEILGYDMQQDSLRIRQRVGVLHERPAYPNRMTVGAYLTRVERLYKKNGNVERALTMVDLLGARNRRIGALSAGMLQRLGIAQSLIGEPELVFLDEPTSNLDIDGRDSVTRMIIDIHNETGVSFVISSHVLSELERVCHNIAIIRKGKVVATGGVQETIRKYTGKRYRIVASDPKGLFDIVRQLEGILNAQITGANAITIRIDSPNVSDIERRVKEAAASLDIHVYAIEKAETLEDALRELVLDEE
jgi:ABC-2 type transport system ATP-binding protein